MAFTSVIEIDVKDDKLKSAIAQLDEFKAKIEAINKLKLKLNTENFFLSADKILRKLNAIDAAMTSIQKKSATVFNAPSTMAYSMAITDVSNKVSKLSSAFTEANRNKKMLFSDSSGGGGGGTSGGKTSGGNWLTRGWENFLPKWPAELKRAGLGGASYGGLGMMLSGMKTIAGFAIKLPFQIVGVGLSLAMKGIKLLMSSVKTVLGMLASVFKGLGIGIGAFGGLVSAGILGMYSRATAVSEKAFFSRAAIGMNPGDIDRLQAGFGRFVEPQAFLSKIAEQQNALYSPAFARMGMSQTQARKLSTEEAGGMVLQRARTAFTTGGMAPNELSLRMLGLDQLMSVQDAQRISSYTKEQFDEIIEFTKQLKESTQFKDTFQWERFKMRGAGGIARVEAAFTNQLVKLTDPLDKMFTSIYNAFNRKGGPNALSDLMDYFAKGLERVARAFDTGDFKSLLVDAFEEFKRLAGNVFDWLWESFKKNHKEFATNLENLWKTFKELIPTWDQLKLFGTSMRDILPSWEQFSLVLKSMPELWTRGEDAFWDLIEAIDKFIWKITHWGDEIGYRPSEWLQPPTGSRQYERRRMRDQEQELLDRMYAREPDYNQETPGVFTRGYRSAVEGLFGREDVTNRAAYKPASPELQKLYEEAGNKWGVDPEVLKRQGFFESGYNPKATSSAGAMGISQFTGATAKKYGINPFDVEESIDAQAHMMRELLDKFDENYALALAGYNWGPNRKSLAKGDLSMAPEETKRYVEKILGSSERTQKNDYSMSGMRWTPPQQSPAIPINIQNATGSNLECTVGRMQGSLNNCK